jgi:hypothetical protein
MMRPVVIALNNNTRHNDGAAHLRGSLRTLLIELASKQPVTQRAAAKAKLSS